MVDYRIVSRLGSKRVLVIGDFVLDAYTIGVAERISPEAPVAIVRVQSESFLPGMAGNVALNLAALGAKVTVLGRLGMDETAALIEKSLQERGIETHLFKEDNYKTAIKNRIIADSQQIVRVDKEEVRPLTSCLEDLVLEKLESLLTEVDIVAISDYGKGFCTRRILSHTIALCQKRGLMTVVDPKGVDFSKYFGCTIIKPNRKEALLASGLEQDASFDSHAKVLLNKTSAKYLLVTLAEKGMGLFSEGAEPVYFTASKREIRDVTGAGDTVLASLVFSMANHFSIEESIQLANVAAGIAIERFGCAQVTLSDVSQRLLQERVKNKTYDQATHEALESLLKDLSFTLFEIAKGERLTSELWRSIYECKQEDRAFVVLVQDKEFAKENLPLLASLEQVDFIVTDFYQFKESFHPVESYLFQNGALHCQHDTVAC